MPAVATEHDAVRVYNGALEIESLESAGTIPGVYVVTAAGRCGVGTGELRRTADGTGIKWRAPGDTLFGLPIYPTTTGEYLIESADLAKWLRIHVTMGWESASVAHRVFLGDVYDNGLMGTDVTAVQASGGDTLIEELTIANDSAKDVTHVRAWLDPSVQDLSLSLDQIGWFSPTTEAAAIELGTIPAGNNKSLYVRRLIGAGKTSDARRTNILELAYDQL